MTVEENVLPAAGTENQAAELTNEAPEVVTPENVETTEQGGEPEKVEEDDRERERKRFQRRMDRRTAELYRERAEREALAARLAQLEGGKPAPKDGEEPTQRDEPKADPYKIAREIADQERFVEKCNKVAAEGSKKFKDFDAALQSVVAEVGPLFDQRGRPSDLMKVVMEADAPAAVLHYLGTNPEAAAELADLSPTQLARRLDRIERDIAQQAKPKASSAPKPLTPVKGTQAPRGMPDPSDTKAWIRAANEAERAARR
jgi:hypothetical protein